MQEKNIAELLLEITWQWQIHVAMKAWESGLSHVMRAQF